MFLHFEYCMLYGMAQNIRDLGIFGLLIPTFGTTTDKLFEPLICLFVFKEATSKTLVRPIVSLLLSVLFLSSMNDVINSSMDCFADLFSTRSCCVLVVSCCQRYAFMVFLCRCGLFVICTLVLVVLLMLFNRF